MSKEWAEKKNKEISLLCLPRTCRQTQVVNPSAANIFLPDLSQLQMVPLLVVSLFSFQYLSFSGAIPPTSCISLVIKSFKHPHFISLVSRILSRHNACGAPPFKSSKPCMSRPRKHPNFIQINSKAWWSRLFLQEAIETLWYLVGFQMRIFPRKQRGITAAGCCKRDLEGAQLPLLTPSQPSAPHTFERKLIMKCVDLGQSNLKACTNCSHISNTYCRNE